VIYTDAGGGTVKGSLRLLPTTGPTLFADHFADTLPDAALLSAPSIWECTRFCVDREAMSDSESFLSISGILIAALGDLAIRTGIETIMANFEPPMLRLYRRLGCEVEVIGSASRDGVVTCLGSFYVSEQILGRIKTRLAGLGIDKNEHSTSASAPADRPSFTSDTSLEAVEHA
jgi:acyl homoserine lactone synthase